MRTTWAGSPFFSVDDDAHALAVDLVADVGDALDALVADELGDLLDEPRLVDLVGDLGDDDRPRGRPCADSSISACARMTIAAAAGAVGLHDALAPADEAAGREVRARDALA